MIRNLILTGGPAHDYDQTAPVIANFLTRVGIESEVTKDFDILETRGLGEFQLLTLYCTRATYVPVPGWTEEWGFELSEDARAEILRFLGDGKGLVALHAASGCFDDWPEYPQIIGAWWEWHQSSHPPVQKFSMRVNAGAHPVVDGIEDFEIELFMNLKFTDRVTPLIDSDWEGISVPVVWIRSYGGGPVYYNGLGHGLEAVNNPAYQRLVQQGARWAAGMNG